MVMFSGDSPSGRYQLSVEDLKKIGVGLLIAAGGAALTYLAEIIPNVDFGIYAPVAVAVASVLINAGRKFLASLS